MKKYLRVLLAAVMALSLMCVSAFASPFPDLGRTGSLSVTIRDTVTKEGIPGGTVVVYQAAAVATETENGGPMFYQLTDAFADSDVSLTNLDSESVALAGKLSAYAEQNDLSGWERTPDEDGVVYVGDLDLGVYLVVQTESAPDYNIINPFIVTIPQKDGENWIYDVDAAPKTETGDADEDGDGDGDDNDTPPTEPPTPDDDDGNGDDDDNDAGDGDDDDKDDGDDGSDSSASASASTSASTSAESSANPHKRLPQTGQLWWPVYVMAAVGLLFFAWGWSRKEKEKNE